MSETSDPPDPQWQDLNFAGLKTRLMEIKRLLEHAAALTAAQDAERIESLSRLAADQHRRPPAGRKYR